MKIKKEIFGELNNKTIYEYTLTNSSDLSLSVISYGGIITKIKMPDLNGTIEEVTINLKKLDEIVKYRPFHGAIIGPVAGRISNGRYLDGQKIIQLDQNEGKNTLHSGYNGLDTKIWKVQTQDNKDEATLILKKQLKNELDGFPGDIDITVSYSLTEAGEIIINYEAKTDQKTLFNPTNHVYFNLSGNNKEPIYNHEFKLASDYYAVLDDENIPTGELKLVDLSDFDFRKAKKLHCLVEADDQQITDREGLDHPFVLSKHKPNVVAELYHKKSGRKLEMITDAAAVVVYTHNHRQEGMASKNETLGKHSGIALETSALPDAVNQDNFGSVWLDKNQIFKSETTYKFSLN